MVYVVRVRHEAGESHWRVAIEANSQRITSIDFSGSTAAKRSAPPPHASGPGRNGAPRPRAVRIDDAPVVAAPAPPSPASTIDAGEVPNARSVGPDSEGFFLGQKPRQRSASRSA